MSSGTKITGNDHSAIDAALGFYYQSLYGLLAAVKAVEDDATVCLERLDDVEIVLNGKSLLVQLKHSLSKKPKGVSLASVALWKTLRAWIDVLPKLSLDDTRFQLVTVAPLPPGSVLAPLLDEKSSRSDLLKCLEAEAKRVIDEHAAAEASGKNPLPHVERLPGCSAFLALPETTRNKLLSRATIQPAAHDINKIQLDITSALTNFPPDQREAISQRLVEWWDLQIVYSFCGKRERFITRLEVLQRLLEIAGELAREELLADFQFQFPPDDHNPPSMIATQLELVGCTMSEIQSAQHEEWKARSQRHKWMTERMDMAVRIDRYDKYLVQEWRYRHKPMAEQHHLAAEDEKRAAGLGIFKWSFFQAHREVDPFAQNWNSSYYVRGSYQVLAVEQSVGWHPDYVTLLKGCA
ncbi:ABC-three component system protein [Xanthomonas sacchari]|uniref:ABC-three component system protein n=1 Tax=Xanthomonas sp. SHU 308 TaxID=1591201 RepID=UPI0004770B55|nr:ABC-three component system protein [Xanthomonas sp. SHU 308]